MDTANVANVPHLTRIADELGVDVLFLSEVGLPKGHALPIPRVRTSQCTWKQDWTWQGHVRTKCGGYRGGGVGFMLRSDSAHTLEMITLKHTRALQNVMWVKVTGHNLLTPVFIGGVYIYARPGEIQGPRKEYECATRNALQKDIMQLEDQFHAAPIYLVGDFNARVGTLAAPPAETSSLIDATGRDAPRSAARSTLDDKVNDQGRQLVAMAERCGMYCLNGAQLAGVERPARHTWFRNTHSGRSLATVVDHVWGNYTGCQLVREMRVLQAEGFASDHHPVLLEVQCVAKPGRQRRAAPRMPTRFPSRHNMQVWEPYADAASAAARKLVQARSVDCVATDLTAILMAEAKQLVLPKHQLQRHLEPRWLKDRRNRAEELRRLLREACKAVTKWTKEHPDTGAGSRDEEERRALCRLLDTRRTARSREKRAARSLVQGVGLQAAEVAAKLLWSRDDNVRNEKLAWSVLRGFIGGRGGREERVLQGQRMVIPFRNRICAKTTAAAATDERYCRDTYESYLSMLHDIERAERTGGFSDGALNMDISLKEVQSALNKLKLHKASGPDGCAAELLRHAQLCSPDEYGRRPVSAVVLTIHKLLKRVLQTGVIPESWKHGNVTPVYKKKGNPDVPDSYRPITVTNSLCKVLGHIITARFEQFVETNQLLSQGQCGYRRGRCVEDAVYMITEVARVRMADTSRRRQARFTCVAFLDIKGAFDTVFHEALLVEIWRLGVRGPMWCLIRNWLRGTKRRVKVGSVHSEEYQPTCGVPQGEVLSPLLYELFEDILCKAMAEMMEDCGKDLAAPKDGDNAGRDLATVVHYLLYADDSALVATSAEQLGSMLSCCHAVAQAVRFEFAPSKSQVMVFGPGGPTRRKLEQHRWYLGGKLLRVETKQLVYLGVTLTPRLGWRAMQAAVAARLPGRVGSVCSMNRAYGADHPRLIRAVGHNLVGSTIETASAVWAGSAVTAQFVGKCERAWGSVMCVALRLPRRASFTVLRGEMGVWRVRSRWIALRLIMYFKYALLPEEDWRSIVWHAGRRLAMREVPVAAAWHTDTRKFLTEVGFPALAWDDPRAYLAQCQEVPAGGTPALGPVRPMVMQQLGDYDNRLWQQEVQQTERLQHTYTRLGLRMRNSVADYLYTRRRRAQRLRSQLRCDMYPYLRTHYFRTRFHHFVPDCLDPPGTPVGPPRRLPFGERYCWCYRVGGVGDEHAVDSVEHFLLDCTVVGVGGRRQKLWTDITALGTDPELAPSVAVVAGVLAQVAAPREVVGAIPDAQRLILLRLLLDGDLKDAMPEGYTSVHETPLCGAALAHARMLELADGFLCDIAAARAPHFRYWATKTGSRLRQAARDYASQHD